MRSILFVPGDRSDRFPKALASGADAICVDLEDGVAPPGKAAARQSTVAFLSQLEAAPCAVFVRVNGVESPVGVEDLEALSQPFCCLSGLLLPKCISSDSVAAAAERLDEASLDLSLAALIEDPAGLRRAHEIAAHPRVWALVFGPLDLALSLGATPSPELLTPIRVQLRLAAAEAGKAAIDGPYVDIPDLAGLRSETALAAKLGYDGKLAIHPTHIPAINQGFTPSREQIESDRRIIAAVDASEHGVVVVDGRMIDKPVVDAARRRVKLADRFSKGGEAEAM